MDDVGKYTGLSSSLPDAPTGAGQGLRPRVDHPALTGIPFPRNAPAGAFSSLAPIGVPYCTGKTSGATSHERCHGGHNARIGPFVCSTPDFRAARPETKRIPMATTLYGIKNCDTIKKARKWLEEAGIDYRFHDHRADGLAPEQLDSWLERLGWEALLNTRGTTFRALPDEARQDLDTAKARACCWNTRHDQAPAAGPRWRADPGLQG